MVDLAKTDGEAVPLEDPRQRADESVASRFTRIMNATTSPIGAYTDPPVVALVSAVFFVAYLGARARGMDETVVQGLGGLALLPIVSALIATLALLGARARTVEWLAKLPFPLENMNAILNGLGDSLEVTFTGAPPAASELNTSLDAVHPDAFVTGVVETTRIAEVRIGVVDSKRNPGRSNFQRFARVRSIVEQVLVPLHQKHEILEVRVK